MFETFRRTKTYGIESETVEETLGADAFSGKRPEQALEEPFEELLEDEDEPDDLVGTYEGVLEDQRGRERGFRVDVTRRGGGVIIGGGMMKQIPKRYEARASVEPIPSKKKASKAVSETVETAARAGGTAAEHTLVPAGEAVIAGMERIGDTWDDAKQAVYEAAATEYDAEIYLVDENESHETTALGLSVDEARHKVKKDAKKKVDDIRSSPSAVYRLDDGDEEYHFALKATCSPNSHSWSTYTELIDEETFEDYAET